MSFSDSVEWVARVRLSETSGDEETVAEMESEIATIFVLQKGTTIRVPTVYAYNLDPGNQFGYRYMLMEALPGRHMSSGLARSVPPEHHAKIANQLADYYFELSKIRFDKIGKLSFKRGKGDEVSLVPFYMSEDQKRIEPLATSLEYFYLHRRIQNQAIASLQPHDKDWRTARWVLNQALSEIVIGNAIYGPFPIGNLDLHYENILVDDAYNITGFVDWTSAQTVPWELFFASPEFITFPALSKERNQPILDFRSKVSEGLEARSGCCGWLPCNLSQLIGSRKTEIAYRCTYTYPRRALWDAQLVSRLLFRPGVSWEYVKYISRTNADEEEDCNSNGIGS